MKVAIIGAGIAGLSCAHALEKEGIRAVVFERNGFIGEQYSHCTAALEIIHRPIRDAVKYFKEKLGIEVQPINTVNTLIHNAPHKRAILRGQFGYFFNRGREKDDLKNQIYSQLNNTEVLFNRNGDYKKLSREYDYVVIATGTSMYAEEMGCWQEWLNTQVRGATILGDFDPNTITVWFNRDYCKNGYAYLTPFDRKRASLVLIVTDVDDNEVDAYWEAFVLGEKINYDILEEFKLNHKSGYVYPYKIGNIYIAGNASGIVDPFLGFGHVSSAIMGAMAGRAIAKNEDYQGLIKDIIQANIRLHEFRKAFNKLDNFGYDIMLTALGMPGVKKLLYDTPINIVKYGSALLKIINK